jgi:outer membrane receptor for ferrienterochelin and colicin
MKINLFTFIFSLLIIFSVSALDAQIKGKITDKLSGEVLEGATVLIPELNKGTYADEEGKFEFSGIPAGSYSLIYSYVSYRRDTIRNVQVQKGRVTELDIQMVQEKEMGVEEISIVEVRSRISETSLISDLKQNEQIVSGVSAEQIRRSPDRDAAEVIRRLPGVTLSDGRYAMIRGLNERYNTVLLNGGPAPAAEADTKAFSFDLVPSGLISRMMIVKTASAEHPGEMAGGMVKVETQAMPEGNAWQAGVSLGYRQYTSFENFTSYSGSPTDFLGIDNGVRALPSWFPSHINTVRNNEYLTSVSKSLPNTWAVQNQTAIPDPRLSVTFTHKANLKKFTFGTTQGLTYSLTSVHNTIERYNYNAFNQTTQKSDTIYHFTDNQFTRNSRVGLMSNYSLLFPSGHKLEWRNLLNQSGSSVTTARTGRNLEEGSYVRNYSLGWQQRGLFSSQLSGLHPIWKDKTEVNWQLGYAYSRMQEPDLKRVRTIRPLTAPESQPYQVVIPPSASTLDAARFFSDSKEQVISGQAQIEHKLGGKDEDRPIKLRSGIWTEMKSRSFQARWMSYKRGNNSSFNYDLNTQPVETIFSESNIDPVSGFVLAEGTNPSDQYEASNQNIAGFVYGSFPVTDWLTLQGGLRSEFNRQQLSSRDYNDRPVEVDNPILFWLPSGNATVKITEKAMVRGAAGITVNRPEFRELAPFAYYDFAFNNVLYGNPDLKTPTIQNLDIRWEFYPTIDEYIHFGVFQKTFNNPIEQFFVPGTGSGGTRNFTFNNADKANSIGVEAEIRKSFRKWTKLPILKDMGALLNASIIQSEVNLGAASRGQLQVRPMQGQAPYVINTGLLYSADSAGLRVSLQYNVYGRRLFAVGTFGTPDIYEMPRHLVDVTVSKSISKRIDMRLSVQDLLNARFYLKQDSNEDGKISDADELVLDTRRGRYITLGVNIRL